MKQEQKELLLKDLCARLPYGVKVNYNYLTDYTLTNTLMVSHFYELMKPYLRPMSSMTEEERSDLRKYCAEHRGITYDIGISGATNSANIINWLLAHHFDIYDLIPMDLAIAVTKENNPYKN